jgi:hypothetical protein
MPRSIRGISSLSICDGLFDLLDLTSELHDTNAQFASAPLNRLASRWEPDIDRAFFAWMHGVFDHENHPGKHRVVLAAPTSI